MSSDIQKLQRAAKRWWVKAERARWLYGTLGRKNSDGTVTIASGRQNFVYITMDTGTLTEAYNKGNGAVPLRAGLPVRVRQEAGRLIIDGENTSGLLEGDENAPSTVFSVNDIGPDGTGNVTLDSDDIPEGATNLYYTAERARDDIATSLVAGTGITVTPNDGADTITIASTITQYTDEAAQDAVGTILVDSTTIDFTYTDATPSITAVRAALTGDVTASANSNATAIGANKVLTAMIADAQLTLAKMANLAADTIIGRANAAGTGVPQALTAAQVVTIIQATLTTLFMDLTTTQTAAGLKTFSSELTSSIGVKALAASPYFLLENTTANQGYFRFVQSGAVHYLQSGLTVSAGSAAALHFSDVFASNIWMTLGATGVLGIGIQVPGATRLGIKAGTSTNDAAVGGTLFVDSGTHGNTTGGETDLASYSVPANTLSANNMSLEFEMWGTYVNNANVKAIKVYFGTDNWLVLSSNNSAEKWFVRGRIIRTGAATQDVVIQRMTAAPSTGLTISTATRTLSSANTLKLTGLSTSGLTNDIVQQGMIVKWDDANT